jgi:hypothetical protein
MDENPQKNEELSFFTRKQQQKKFELKKKMDLPGTAITPLLACFFFANLHCCSILYTHKSK